MKWKSEYATGIHNLDNQHRTILEIITRFERMGEGRAHWDQVHPLVQSTRRFMEYHFDVEESLMRLIPYSELSTHRDEHRNALARIADIERRVGRESARDRVAPAMKTLLLGHITGSDRRFAQCALDLFRRRPFGAGNDGAHRLRGPE